MGNRHVVPAEKGWRVVKEGAQQASATTATQAEAIERAREIIAKDGGGELVIHAQDGTIRESRTIAAG
jgi:uncharacterized protein YdaT